MVMATSEQRLNSNSRQLELRNRPGRKDGEMAIGGDASVPERDEGHHSRSYICREKEDSTEVYWWESPGLPYLFAYMAIRGGPESRNGSFHKGTETYIYGRLHSARKWENNLTTSTFVRPESWACTG